MRSSAATRISLPRQARDESRPDGRHGGDATVAWVTTRPATRDRPGGGSGPRRRGAHPSDDLRHPSRGVGVAGTAHGARSRGRRGGRKPQESSSPHGGGPLVESFTPPRATGDPFHTGRSKVEGGRAAAERRHGPARGCPARRSADEVDTTARSERPHLLREGRPLSRRGASPRRTSTGAPRERRRGKGRRVTKGPRLDRRKALEGRSPGEQRPRRTRETGRREHGLVGGGRLRSRRSRRTR